jgi:uncharacterized protein (DUF4415 family)
MKRHTRDSHDELTALARMPDHEIDTSDIPETTDWSHALVGKFYRPIKEPVTLRIDADVLEWLKSEGPGYQTRLNSLLRHIMSGGPGSEPLNDQANVREFRFRRLERHGELEKCNRDAELIEARQSIFAACA